MLRIGEKITLTKDIKVEGLETTVLKEGTDLYVGADKEFFYMVNSKLLKIPEDMEISDGYSAKGLSDWIYQRVRAEMGLDGFLEYIADELGTEFSEQVEVFKNSIVEALTDLGFYGEDGNTH